MDHLTQSQACSTEVDYNYVLNVMTVWTFEVLFYILKVNRTRV
jgi:hypothetical protein